MKLKAKSFFVAAMAVSLTVVTPLAANAGTNSIKKGSTAQVTAYRLNVRSEASKASKALGTLKMGQKIKIIKTTKTRWVGIKYKNKLAYISKRFLKKATASNASKKVKASSVKASDASYSWAGRKLTRSAGVVYGPSGKETYYNLNMSRVVRNMYNRGFSGTYWVRNDGVKMFGDYVMVAANLSIRPFGTHVKTSLGMGIVVDTGSFAYRNRTQLDIAVNW